MNNDFIRLKNDLESIGVREGDSLLLHSSFKSLGTIEGGIQTLVDALLSTLGERGTLIAPTLTYAYVTEDNPVFDYVNTPSCVGAVSEYVRNMKGAVRSIHPTHSCSAIGYRAEEFTRGHDRDVTPVGENSPFRKLRDLGGKILMLGCPFERNTSMHGVEELFGTSYLLKPVPSPYRIILPDGEYTIQYRRHHIMQNGYAQRYDRVIPLMSREDARIAEIHSARSCLIDSAKMWQAGLSALSRDELSFVERIKN